MYSYIYSRDLFLYQFFDVSDVAFRLFLLWLIFVDVLITFSGFYFLQIGDRKVY